MDFSHGGALFGAVRVTGCGFQGTVLLLLTFALSMLTFGTGRTDILFGLVHMAVSAVFLFMVLVP